VAVEIGQRINEAGKAVAVAVVVAVVVVGDGGSGDQYSINII
jgi:hypothetical protein